MRVIPFELEQYQAEYEDTVEINLSESGVRSRSVADLYELGLPELSEHPLGYPVAKGSDTLRENIAGWYPRASPANVVPTNGGCEANFLSLWSLLEGEDQIAMMVPNFLQPLGVADAFGAVRTFQLTRLGVPARWGLDLASLHEAVTPSTKVIWVCNPNNPTGAVLTEAEMEEIVSVAGSVGAWIVSDEIYRGAELGNGTTTPTFWGRYDKVIVTASLSKAFGLAGLRLGWVVASEERASDLRSHRDYTSSMVGHLSDTLGAFALRPDIRERILSQTRGALTSNLAVVEEWVQGHPEVLALISPVAGAIAFVELKVPMGDIELCDRMREERSVLFVPGTYLGMGGGIRVGFGYSADKTRSGLERAGDILVDLAAGSSR